MRPSPDAGRELVAGFLRPATLAVLASLEGLGKSGMRTEVAIRGATGTGPLFGYFDIPAPFRVATFDEENGPDEELRRDRATLGALGLEQSDLGDRYQRASFAGLNLNAPGDRAYLDAEIARTRPDLLILDTAGSMVADEWGAPLKETMRYLRSLVVRFGVAVLLIVHMTKPSRNGKAGPVEVHGTKLSDVMGQWTRAVDVVGLLADLGAGRVRLEVMKRAPHVVLILERDGGLWRLLTTGEPAPVRDRTDDRVLRAIAAGAASAEDLAESLELSRRAVYNALGRLRKGGFVTAGTPLRLTPDGEEAIG
jgi:DNA-binding transcriptional ArsR family regulator